MFKCSKCIFFEENGYVDMGCSIPLCKFKLVEEERKKNNNQKYDLYSALIDNELQAEQCPYFHYVVKHCHKERM